MAERHPTVSVTSEALIIRIPWNTVDVGAAGSLRREQRLTIQDVLEMVAAGRLAHRLRKTRSIRSLKDVLA